MCSRHSMIIVLSSWCWLSEMLVGWRVEELDLGREFASILLFSEDVERVFFGDVPLDGGVGAGGAYGLDLVLSYLK